METWSTIITAKATAKTEQNRKDQIIDDLLKILERYSQSSDVVYHTRGYIHEKFS